jgi:hypothetical protein
LLAEDNEGALKILSTLQTEFLNKLQQKSLELGMTLTRLIDLSQPLNQEAPFWPLYPPFEVKFIKRKPEHGVNAQYIQTSNHMGTHLDAPLHFVTGGKDIEKIPLEIFKQALKSYAQKYSL